MVSPAVGDKFTLTIQDIAFGGEGVARLDDFVIFVPFVALNERVEVELVEVKKRFGRAKLVQVLQPSPERIEPKCPYFGACGGCQYQHLSYATQLRMKHKQIRDQFERIGGLNPKLIQEPLPCPEPYHYRNRIMIRSQWDKFKQGLNIGYLRYDNRLVIDIDQCPIAEHALNAEILKVRAHPPPKGGIKVVLRIFPSGWQVPRDSFFQNNFFLLPKLVEVARAFFKAGGARHLIDVFCGVGFFSLELADLAESYVGVELDRLAIKAARENAVTRNRMNGEFVSGPAEQLLPELMARFTPGATAVLLDPPRTGCRPETIELLRQVRPSQIIYVSCHPATMSRDLNMLTTNNVFNVVNVVPLDMFPQTAHVECVADVRVNRTSGEVA